MSNVFISDEIFLWVPSSSTSRYGDENGMQRSYDLLDHAASLLSAGCNDFARADAIANLKRAVNVRLQLLDESYAFSKGFPRNVGALERLEIVGLARPYLVKHLISLRNDIEHQDIAPPNVSRCRELLDIIWYFLRATDAACKMIPESVEFNRIDEGLDSKHWFELEILSPELLSFEIRGRFPAVLVAYEPNGNFVPMECSEFEQERPRNSSVKNSRAEIYLSGIVKITQKTLHQVWRTILK